MEIKVLIDEKRKTTSIEYDESKTDKGTVGTKELPAVERDILRLLCCETMVKGGNM